jgi:hypothetical protein
MVEWANISRESSLDLECNIFIRSLCSFMQDNIDEYLITHPSDINILRDNYTQWIWRNILHIDNDTNNSASTYFKNLELLTIDDIISRRNTLEHRGDDSLLLPPLQIPPPRTTILCPRRYNLGFDDTNQVFTNAMGESVIIDLTSNEFYVFTVMQFFNMGSLNGVYHKDCNRRTCDYVLNIVTGEILKNDWIYDYLDGYDRYTLENKTGTPHSSSNLFISRTVTYNSKVLFLGGFYNISLNYPIGLPL